MAEIKKFKKNDVVFLEGDKGDFMYEIISGKVGVYADYGRAEQKLLATLGKEDFIGEMGMIEKKPRSATAVALESTEAVLITSENFESYLANEPKKAVRILRYTSSRLRKLSIDYVGACAAASEYLLIKDDGLKQTPELMKRIKAITDSVKKKK